VPELVSHRSHVLVPNISLRKTERVHQPADVTIYCFASGSLLGERNFKQGSGYKKIALLLCARRVSSTTNILSSRTSLMNALCKHSSSHHDRTRTGLLISLARVSSPTTRRPSLETVCIGPSPSRPEMFLLQRPFHTEQQLGNFAEPVQCFNKELRSAEQIS
jgi:hypothetical protein